MEAEQVGKVDRIVHTDTGLAEFSKYNVPSKHKKLKINLLQLGLDPNECDMYILLLENGSKKLIEIASLIGFDRTYTYHIMCGLQNKGLATVTFKHPIQFNAVPSEKALKILSKCKRNTRKEKQERLAKLSRFIFTANKGSQHNFMELDLDGAYSKVKEMQLSSKHEILILAHEDDLIALSNSGFMNALKTQSQNGIDVKILVSPNQNSIDVLQGFEGKVRYMERNALEPFSFVIIDNNQMLVIERNLHDNDKKLRAVWTTFEPFISALYFLFSDLWESSMPLANVKEKFWVV